MKKLSVKFEGEAGSWIELRARNRHPIPEWKAGIDAQGLTKELYTAFFSALCGSSDLFETADDNPHPTYLPKVSN